MEFFPKGYDSFKIYLFKKVERISIALYLCTNPLADDISLKTNIRAVADILIKDILFINRGQSNLNSTSKIKEDFLELKTLLNFSVNSNLISISNVNILLDEINKLNKEIENHKDILIGDTEFKKSFFVVESRQKISENISDNSSDYKGHKGHNNLEKDLDKKEENKEINKGQSLSFESNSRTEDIMKIIKDNGKVTIKDISNRIKNCSEKTIQRELLKMVSLNLIKKEGERRWSTYSVV